MPIYTKNFYKSQMLNVSVRLANLALRRLMLIVRINCSFIFIFYVEYNSYRFFIISRFYYIQRFFDQLVRRVALCILSNIVHNSLCILIGTIQYISSKFTRDPKPLACLIPCLLYLSECPFYYNDT